ncbi:F0F1 ATP synthase subunit B [Alkalilimnicola ehrlichii]|uniref:ATP synthase subunit b n=1 Tax=Alkalilimnicola ehrlichii TaxID=351052 RepID=A0A3E0X1A9_9GAMM|nr:F0F1 ATP synthase subunit B [Alkalilimnicola ehrlichii]RFA30638.1 F0F1 ATP synthase subunit B [Alkalilimnicola ehrlichii]RFA38219.1 F0F1 ATP synthase subunit B [Alkalilimnicola ehrlichii]
MDINATLFGQMIAFALFVWFTMKFVWPPISEAMRDRQQKIADGLAAAERGQQDLDLAQERASEILREARQQAAEIMEKANKRGNELVEEAKTAAREEGERQIAAAQAKIEQELNEAKAELREQLVTLAITGATKVLEREISAEAHNDMLNELAKQL